MDKLSFFDKVMFEAPGDPPDTPAEESSPPDIAESDTVVDLPDISEDDDNPPDINNDDISDDSPPDMDMSDEGDLGFDDNTDDASGEENDDNNNLGFDEKISAIMNKKLYQQFLSLLNNIGGQLSIIKHNNDMIYTISNDSLNIIGSLKKLDENVRLYLEHNFLHENYSTNLLFFNKCLNLLKLLNTTFEGTIKKGIKLME